MTEFTILSLAVGDQMRLGAWNEIRDGIMNRGKLLEKLTLIPAYPSTGNRTAPTQQTVGNMPTLIVNYRTRIDDLATFWYSEASISGGSPATYANATALHQAAFGEDNWDYGADDLTPQCPTYQEVWNDMKACLDVMKWLAVDTGTFAATDNEYLGGSIAADDGGFDWDTERAAAFADVSALGHTNEPDSVGRMGSAVLTASPPSPDRFYTTIWTRDDATDTFATSANLTSLAVEPNVSDGYLDVDYVATHIADGGDDYYSNLNVDVYIESQKVTNSPLAIVTSSSGTRYIHLNDVALATIDLDTTNNDIVFKDSDVATRTTDIGASWDDPENHTPHATLWWQSVEPTTWALYLEFSWD